MQKVKMNSDFFSAGPFGEIYKAIQNIIDERRPYMITGQFIKSECETVILAVDGKKYRQLKSYCLFVPGHLRAGDIVEIDKRNLLNY
jgi:hypothetical protein